MSNCIGYIVMGAVTLIAFVAFHRDTSNPRVYSVTPRKPSMHPSGKSTLSALAAQDRLVRKTAVTKSLEGASFYDWIDVAAKRITAAWPTVNHEDAVIMVKDYLRMCNMNFQYKGYDWSFEAAHDFADELMRECGEELSNS